MSPSDCESGYDLALGLVLLLLMGAGFVGAADEGLDQAPPSLRIAGLLRSCLGCNEYETVQRSLKPGNRQGPGVPSSQARLELTGTRAKHSKLSEAQN